MLVKSAREGGRRLDAAVFRELKKRLIERQCHGLLEFIEPKWTLDTVVGHEAAKARLREDAALLKRGATRQPADGLSLLRAGRHRQVVSRAVRERRDRRAVRDAEELPIEVRRRDRRATSKACSSVLRAMGPVVVVVDEADAALGSRESEGDSGTSSRVFGMIATQMGDTRYRGRIIWMLLTARPDLLPIDLKRQGRAEVHIPLFYPTDEQEIRQMFVILAGKLGSTLSPNDVPAIPQKGQLSGADIEGMVGRAWRTSLLAGQDHVTKEALADVVAQFLPSTQGLERELQETAAMIECTDRQFLPPAIVEKMEAAGGRGKLDARLDGAQAARGRPVTDDLSERRTVVARTSWFDDKGQHPMVHDRVNTLESFTSALADGVVAPQELESQEQRLIAAMRTLEPALDDDLHAKVTTVLVELSAYNIMRLLHELQAERVRTAFGKR